LPIAYTPGGARQHVCWFGSVNRMTIKLQTANDPGGSSGSTFLFPNGIGNQCLVSSTSLLNRAYVPAEDIQGPAGAGSLVARVPVFNASTGGQIGYYHILNT
jgi:hypothetical protein